MNAFAEWGAPAATAIAAIMTAANLGTRVTGWGFVVFTIGSLLWSYIGISTGQTNLLFTNGFLTMVNLVGVWRWLGRQTKLERGSERMEENSNAAEGFGLFASSALLGSKVISSDDEEIGQVVDVLMHCGEYRIEQVIVTDGGIGGVAEKLRSIAMLQAEYREHILHVSETRAVFERRSEIEPDDWSSYKRV